MTIEKTIEDDIKEAMVAASEPVEAVEDVIEEAAPEPIADKEPVINEVIETDAQPVVTEVKIDAPVALSGAIKAKWNELPADVRAEWKKREDDIHRMMTAKDGELNLGRSVKEIAAPYEAVIRAEGGTVESAFKDLLNTSYVLRAGSPMQKAQIIAQAVQQFGVDLSLVSGQPQQGGNMTAIQQEINYLRQQADPIRIKTELQEEMQRDKIATEIQAFAANPANVHFETVKSAMGSLIVTGRAKDLQEAYEMAIWSDPSIRCDLLKAQQAQEAEKKKAEMAAKKKASASVAGSPGLASPNANAPQKSLEDELRDSLRSSSGKI